MTTTKLTHYLMRDIYRHDTMISLSLPNTMFIELSNCLIMNPLHEIYNTDVEFLDGRNEPSSRGCSASNVH
jgi:hypothetical protein